MPPYPTFRTMLYRPPTVFPTRFAGVSGVRRIERTGGSVGLGGVLVPAGVSKPLRDDSALCAEGGDKIDRETRRDPSRGQNRASAEYVVPQAGQRFIRYEPGCGRSTWRGRAPRRRARKDPR